MKLNNLVDFFLKLERENDLLNYELKGVKIWQFLRMDIYYNIARKVGTLEQPNVSQRSTSIIFKNILNLVSSLIRNSPIRRYKEYDEILMPHNRSKLINDVPKDIYSYKYLEKNDGNLLIIEKPYNGRHIRKYDRDVINTDLILLTGYILKFFQKRLNKRELAEIKHFEVKIRELFDVDINLKKLFIEGTARFNAGFYLYKRIFRNTKPKKLSLVVSYAFNGDIIYAAKSLGIPVYEFQHGVISKFHLGYHYPQSLPAENYFPDFFISWGEFWNTQAAFPIPKKNIQVGGFEYFREIRKKYVHRKVNKKVLVISQGALGEQMANQFLMYIDAFKGYEVYYKLHPEEYSKSNNYLALTELKDKYDIKILKDTDLYFHLATSEFQIGAFSTALYEGLAFNCKTILLDLPGVEYMSDLIEKYSASCCLVKNGEELKTALSELKNVNLNQDELF